MASELGPGQKDVVFRLRKIEGQARGIQKMIEEGRGCEDIIVQMAALKAAVAKACAAAVTSHLEECLLNQSRDESLQETLARAAEMFKKIST